MSYALASYALVIVAVLAYAVRLGRARRQLASEILTRGEPNRG